MYETDLTVLAGWLTVEQAAAAYNLSGRTIRRRLATRELDAGHLPTAHGRVWRFRPPATYAPPNPAPAPSDDPSAPHSAPGSAMIAIADVDRLLAPILSERDRLLEQVDTLQAARLADALALGRVQGQLAAVQAELARARSVPSPADVTDVTPKKEDAPAPRRRWWHR